jgi:hypothetical protein
MAALFGSVNLQQTTDVVVHPLKKYHGLANRLPYGPPLIASWGRVLLY